MRSTLSSHGIRERSQGTAPDRAGPLGSAEPSGVAEPSGEGAEPGPVVRAPSLRSLLWVPLALSVAACDDGSSGIPWWRVPPGSDAGIAENDEPEPEPEADAGQDAGRRQNTEALETPSPKDGGVQGRLSDAAVSAPEQMMEERLGVRGDTLVSCEFQVDAALSPEIGTVGIITWSTDLEELDNAFIEFGLTETGVTMTAPVDLGVEDYRTLLLGMKGERDYVFRIVASAGDETCVSEDHVITTEPVANAVPQVEVVTTGEHTPGFMVMSGGVGNLGGVGASADVTAASVPVFILDSDGDVVWWFNDSPHSTGRARMDWEGQYMYMLGINVFGGLGDFRGVTMDGLTRMDPPEEMQEGHHDFAVAPGGVLVTPVHEGGCSSIKEWSPTGGVKTLVGSVEELYERADDCHPNAIVYQPQTDTYTLSDRNPNLFVQIDREGNLLWQFGGMNPFASFFETREDWRVNHGHQLLADGTFLFFNNGMGMAPSPVLEFKLDESDWTATKLWEFRTEYSSPTLGDVQRLYSGNTLITYSNAGVILEVNTVDEVVRTITTASMGYVMHRSSLYGPPPK